MRQARREKGIMCGMGMLHLFSHDSLSVPHSVNRVRGTFGTVDLSWTVYQLNISSDTRYPALVSDLSPTSNLISFLEGNTSSTVEFTIMDDTLPELEEMFEVELSIADIFGDSSTGARLGNSSIAVVIVPDSDDPYGLFRIAEGSRTVEVAEDVPAGQPELGSVSVSVERTFGVLGEVEVREEGREEGRGRKGRLFTASSD